MSRRTLILIVAMAVAPLATGVTVAEAQSSQAPVTPPSFELVVGNGQFDFGAERRKSIHILQLAISPRLPPGQRIFPRPGDLVNSGRVFPGSQIKVGKKLATNRRMLKLVISLDPVGVEPGKYEGQLPLFVGGAVNRQIPLTATLSASVGSEFTTAAFAFGAILLGALVGGVLKWLTEKGIRLQELRRQYDAALLHLWNLRRPAGLSRRLSSIELSLNALDVRDAEIGLAQITPRLDGFAEVGSFFDRHHPEIEGQRANLPKRDSGFPAGGLWQIWEHEGHRLDELVDSSWPDPAATKDARKHFSYYVAVVSSFVEAFGRIRSHEEVWRAITDLRNEKTEHAVALLNLVGTSEGEAASLESREIPDVVSAAAAADQKLATSRFETGARTLRKKWFDVRRRAVDNAGFVYGAILAVSVSLLGMSLLYFPNKTFGETKDWLTLVLWGFGVQLTGFTIAQLGGRALGPGPRVTT